MTRIAAALIISALVVGCAHSRRISHRVCADMRIAVDPDVQSSTRLAVFRAIAYWRDLGMPLRYSKDSGEARVVWGSHAMAAPRTLIQRVWGRSWAWSRPNGCVTYAMIEIAPDVMAYPIEIQETVVRHELGHVLGLRDSFGSIDVMGKLDLDAEWPEHPWSASFEDERRLKRVYKK